MRSSKKLFAFFLVVTITATMVMGGCKGQKTKGGVTETQRKGTENAGSENTPSKTIPEETKAGGNTKESLSVGLQQGNIFTCIYPCGKGHGVF